MHPNLFLKWNLDSRVADEVEKTCFRYFLQIKQYLVENDIRHDWHLLTTLVKKCEIVKEGLVFFFGKKRVVFTLEDMFFITGLQIDGYQVSGFESRKNVKVCMDHLGLDLEAAR